MAPATQQQDAADERGRVGSERLDGRAGERRRAVLVEARGRTPPARACRAASPTRSSGVDGPRCRRRPPRRPGRRDRPASRTREQLRGVGVPRVVPELGVPGRGPPAEVDWPPRRRPPWPGGRRLGRRWRRGRSRPGGRRGPHSREQQPRLGDVVDAEPDGGPVDRAPVARGSAQRVARHDREPGHRPRACAQHRRWRRRAPPGGRRARAARRSPRRCRRRRRRRWPRPRRRGQLERAPRRSAGRRGRRPLGPGVGAAVVGLRPGCAGGS